MRVALTVSMTSSTHSYTPGQVVDLDEKHARRLIETGQAIAADKKDTAELNKEVNMTIDEDATTTEDKAKKVKFKVK